MFSLGEEWFQCPVFILLLTILPDWTIFDKGITLKGGQAPAHKYIDKLLSYIVEGKVRLDNIITHRMPLTGHAYDIFKKKEDGCVKIVLDPWR
jgi:threonine dehydrogenase-like Zn-dependent dehydrogenase